MVGKRELNKVDKWGRILLAATKLFRERGYAATTTSDIARAAGIGTGTLFLYAHSKEELLVAVFREEVGRVWDRAFGSMDVDLPLLDQIAGVFSAVLDGYEADPELARAFAHEMLAFTDDAKAPARRFLSDHIGRLEACLVEARSRGDLDDSVDARTLAECLHAVFGFYNQRRRAGSIDLAECRSRLRSATALLIDPYAVGGAVDRRMPRRQKRV